MSGSIELLLWPHKPPDAEADAGEQQDDDNPDDFFNHLGSALNNFDNRNNVENEDNQA